MNMKKVYAHYRLKELGSNRLHHGGGVTVYGEWDEDYHKLRAAGAVCTPEDNYSYKLGRIIAEGRFKKHISRPSKPGIINMLHRWEVEDEKEVHDRLYDVACDLASVLFRKQVGEYCLLRYYRSTGEFEK